MKVLKLKKTLFNNLKQFKIKARESNLYTLDGDGVEDAPVEVGYSNATATLTFGGRVQVNPLKENCPDPKYNLVRTLADINKANPGQVKAMSSF